MTGSSLLVDNEDLLGLEAWLVDGLVLNAFHKCATIGHALLHTKEQKKNEHSPEVFNFHFPVARGQQRLVVAFGVVERVCWRAKVEQRPVPHRVIRAKLALAELQPRHVLKGLSRDRAILVGRHRVVAVSVRFLRGVFCLPLQQVKVLETRVGRYYSPSTTK